MSDGKPVYRGREYYYQSDRAKDTIDKLKKQGEKQENYEYKNNQQTQGTYTVTKGGVNHIPGVF